jgi:hypothetical protein
MGLKTRIDEMDESEVLALTDDQIKWLVRYAMAEDGVKDLPEPIKPEPFVPEFDEEVYEVGGMYFTDHDTAELVRQCLTDNAELMCHLDYNWNKSSAYKYIRETNDFSFQTRVVKVFSKEKYETLSHKMAEHQRSKENYESQFKEYKKEIDKAHEIKSIIMDEIEGHRTRKYQRDRLCNTYRDYLELASGDKETAHRFFEKAYQGIEHQTIYDLVDNNKATEPNSP